jgi:hypothetical protein
MSDKKLQAARRELSRLEWERERETGAATLLTLDRLIRDARWEVEDLVHAHQHSSVIQARRTARVLDGGLAVDAVLVMAFSLGNIHAFALENGTADPIAWFVAPMVDIALIVALSADAFLSHNGAKPTSMWATVLRWLAGIGTLVLNVWVSAVHLDAPAIVLHTVPPVLLLVLAEAAPHYRRGAVAVVAKTEAATRITRATVAAPEPLEPPVAPAATPAEPPAPAAATAPVPEAPAPVDIPAQPVTTGEPAPAEADDIMDVATATTVPRKRPLPPVRSTRATGATRSTPQVPGAGQVRRPRKDDATVLEELAMLRLGATEPLAIRTVLAAIGVGQRRLEALMEREEVSLDPIPEVHPDAPPRFELIKNDLAGGE